MAKTAELRRWGYWGTVVLYALVVAVLVTVLKVFEYHYWIRDLSVEVYIGVVATLFTALGVWLGAKLLGRKQAVAPVAPPTVDADAVRRTGISGRELEVLQLMALGCSNQEIADNLFISLPTGKSHSSSLFLKLEVSRRTQAVVKAKALRLMP